MFYTSIKKHAYEYFFTVLITNCTRLRTQILLCPRKNIHQLNIVKHVESSFKNPYTHRFIFKVPVGTLRNELDDEVNKQSRQMVIEEHHQNNVINNEMF